MEAKHIERLEQVVRVLRELPKENNLDLRFWSRCGTAACVIGWSARDPWFKRRRFKLYKESVPVFRNESGWAAVEEFFGISPRSAQELFHKHSYLRGSKSDIIRRISSFIKQKRKERGLKTKSPRLNLGTF